MDSASSDNERRANRIARMATRGWVNLREFASLIAKSYPTVLAMRDRGNFRYIRVGKEYRVSLEEVERFQLYGNLQDDPNEQAALKAEGL